MALLGAERNFVSLFKGQRDEDFIHSLGLRAIDKVLSIGCADGKELIATFREFGATELYGADAAPWEDATGDLGHGITPIDPGDGLMDMVPLTYDQVIRQKTLRITFEIESEFDLNASPLLMADRKYDLIILSRVVHFMDEATVTALFKILPQRMHDATVVYLRIDCDRSEGIIPQDVLLRLCRDFARATMLKEYSVAGEGPGNYTFVTELH